MANADENKQDVDGIMAKKISKSGASKDIGIVAKIFDEIINLSM